MTALAKNAQRSHKLHNLRLVALPVKAAETIFAGALVCTDANGLAVPGADAAALTFQGVAYRGFDNAEGANGVVDGSHGSVRYCEVEQNGPWSFAVDGATPKAGQDAFLVDDNTVSADATTNSIKVGRFVEPDALSSGAWFVDVERAI